VRCRALSFRRWAIWQDLPASAIADHLGLCPRTLSDWQSLWQQNQLPAFERGRPLESVPVEVRNQVITAIADMGPGTSLRVLQEIFPDLARRELGDLLRRYRQVYRQRRAVYLHALRWTVPGTVWAMDFTEPPQDIDQRFPSILIVRDLSSGCTLLSLPVLSEDAVVVVAALASLVREHGAPLVLKSDNGPGFIAKDTGKFCERHRVLPLLSPTYTPEYNGACEAGVGAIKTHAHHHAAHHDRPGEWTCDDVEAARLQANEFGRPRGFRGSSPDAAWRLRQPIADAERDAFIATAFAYRLEAQNDNACQDPTNSTDHPKARPELDRVAISQALVALGLLEYKRRRLTSPIFKRFSAKIA